MQALLSFDQAPPFSAPFRFFVTAPLFAILAGALLLWSGPELFASRWTPTALALTHLLTAGFMMQVMRGEHIQLRELMASAEQALFSRDGETYAGEAETLLIMMQQHNMKEENVLYPMCDQHLLERAGALLPILQGAIHPSRIDG